MTFKSRCLIPVKETTAEVCLEFESMVKQELFVLLRTIVPISFSCLEPWQELEVAGGSLSTFHCIVVLCSGTAENRI